MTEQEQQLKEILTHVFGEETANEAFSQKGEPPTPKEIAKKAEEALGTTAQALRSLAQDDNFWSRTASAEDILRGITITTAGAVLSYQNASEARERIEELEEILSRVQEDRDCLVTANDNLRTQRGELRRQLNEREDQLTKLRETLGESVEEATHNPTTT